MTVWAGSAELVEGGALYATPDQHVLVRTGKRIGEGEEVVNAVVGHRGLRRTSAIQIDVRSGVRLEVEAQGRYRMLECQ
jgi:hypothetical protein